MKEAQLPEDPRAFWRETARELVKGSIASCDEVAKQLVAVTSLLEGLYFHAIAFSDLRDPAKYPRDVLIAWGWLYLLPIGLLLISLAFALAVFFPQRYKVNLASSDGGQAVFEAIAGRKLNCVRAAGVFLLLAILATLAAAWVYLVK